MQIPTGTRSIDEFIFFKIYFYIPIGIKSSLKSLKVFGIRLIDGNQNISIIKIIFYSSGRNETKLGACGRRTKTSDGVEGVKQNVVVVDADDADVVAVVEVDTVVGWRKLCRTLESFDGGHVRLTADDGQGRVGPDTGLSGQDDHDQESDGGYESGGQ
jgi:hypothetical protein